MRETYFLAVFYGVISTTAYVFLVLFSTPLLVPK